MTVSAADNTPVPPDEQKPPGFNDLFDRIRRPQIGGGAAAASRRIYEFDTDRRGALERYAVLLVIATLLATFGLYKDAATIILAAMLIEQVVVPILAFSFALVTGEPRRQINAAIVIAASAGATVGISWFVTRALLSDRIAVSSQIIANSTPNLTDLVVALIAGAAGAYTILNRNRLTALPGVAVGLSLVPPLCAAGLLLGRGNTAMAGGALLMYVTNLAAIVLSAALVFVLYGYLPRGRLPRQTKIGFAMAAVSVAMVAYPLWIVTATIVSNARDESVVLDITRQWVAPTVFDVESVSLDGEDVEIVLSGPTTPATVDNLAQQISHELGRQIDLHVEVFQRVTVRATGGD